MSGFPTSYDFTRVFHAIGDWHMKSKARPETSMTNLCHIPEAVFIKLHGTCMEPGGYHPVNVMVCAYTLNIYNFTGLPSLTSDWLHKSAYTQQSHERPLSATSACQDQFKQPPCIHSTFSVVEYDKSFHLSWYIIKPSSPRCTY